MDRPLHWTDEDYSKTINMLKKIAVSNLEVSGYDDTTPGDHSISCNHGLCSEDIEDSVPGVYKQSHHKCPLDTRTEADTFSGCFYHCRYFQGHKKKYAKLPSIKDTIIQFQV